MHVGHLKLTNFRNYQNLSIEFSPHFNLVLGPNAQGKTNLLEAIYYLGYLNSFRTSVRAELIRVSSNEGAIYTTIERDGVRHDVGIELTPSGKRVRHNSKTPRDLKDFLGLIPVLLFLPRDVYLFRDTPSIRRRYVDRANILLNPNLIELYRNYHEVVVQKNRLLKLHGAGIRQAHLDVWDQKLIELGSALVYERLVWIEAMNLSIKEEYYRISHTPSDISLEYSCSIPLLKGEETVPGKQAIATALRHALDERGAEEKKRRETVVGPHRDDWGIMLDDKPVGSHGSQGENRTAVIALKMVQLKTFEETHGFQPIFLLDDVASELDSGRVTSLFDSLQVSQGQVFITATEPSVFGSRFSGRGSSFLVEGGKARVIA